MGRFPCRYLKAAAVLSFYVFLIVPLMERTVIPIEDYQSRLAFAGTMSTKLTSARFVLRKIRAAKLLPFLRRINPSNSPLVFCLREILRWPRACI